MRDKKPAMTVLSWGWGRDSTTLALLSKHGELPPLDAIIAADTQWEPDEVYATVEWVLPLLDVPVYRVSQGDLGADVLDALGTSGKWASQPPFYVRNAANTAYATVDRGGTLRRLCTIDYKIMPIRRKLRELLGVKPTGPLPRGMWVEQWLGFPRDELARTFCSDVRWIINTFPLILPLQMTKADCATWLTAHGYPIPAKSSCIFCPYHNNAHWRRMRDTQPEEWAKAVAFEAALHQGKLPGVRGTPYLHKSMVPLPLAPIDVNDQDQEGLFGCMACNT
jgi:hypothetical protein